MAVLGLGLAAAAPAQMPMNHDQGSMGGMQMGHDHAAMKAPEVPAGVLRIIFAGKTTDWKLTDLAALPHQSVTLANAHTKTNQSFSGVPLMDLLVKAGVPAKPHGQDLALYLAAEGSDGYIAALSVAEANPDVHPGTVLVADQLDGQPIAAAGPLMLVLAGETRPARWVRNLVLIKVARAE
jgi:hypothetical protein